LFPAAADVAPAATKLPLHSITTGPGDTALAIWLFIMPFIYADDNWCMFYSDDDGYVRVAFGENKHDPLSDDSIVFCERK